MDVADVMLPYRTEWRAIASLLDYAKGKGVDRSVLEARLGAGEQFRETLNTVEQLGLAGREDSGDIRLTPAGERLAYAPNDSERRLEFARAMLAYAPYGISLERAVAEGLGIVDGPWVERVWQVDMRLGQPRNRVEEARTLFFRLADEAGLGVYRRGVRGQPTRLELDAAATARIAELRDELDAATETKLVAPAPPPVQPVEPAELVRCSAVTAGPTLAVTVDMSDWELDKIEAFLRLVGIVRDDG